MKGKNQYSVSGKTLLLYSIAILLSLWFLKDTLQAPLLLLNDDSQSYELLETIAVEEAADDSESEKKEKKEGAEEFIISGKTVFIPISGTDKFPLFAYNQTFKSRKTEMYTPPPKLFSC